MAITKGQVTNPTGAHIPATRHIATAHKKIRAKGKVHLEEAMQNILDRVQNKGNKFSDEDIFKASVKWVETTLKAEAFYEKAIGVKPKGVSDEGVEEEDDMPEIIMTAIK